MKWINESQNYFCEVFVNSTLSVQKINIKYMLSIHQIIYIQFIPYSSFICIFHKNAIFCAFIV